MADFIDLQKVLVELGNSSKSPAIKEIKKAEKMISDAQKKGLTVPDEILNTYNKMAEDAINVINEFNAKNKSGLKDIGEKLKENLSTGINELTEGFHGIFGSLVNDILNNPFMKMGKGALKALGGGIANIIPKKTNLSTFDVKEEEIKNKQDDDINEKLTMIEFNTAKLVDIWSDEIIDDSIDEKSNSVDEDIKSEIDLGGDDDKKDKKFFSGLSKIIELSLLRGALVAFLTNPLTLSLIGLTTATYLLYDRWSKMSLGEILLDIVEGFASIGNVIADVIGNIFGYDGNIFEDIGKELGSFVFDIVESISNIGKEIGVFIYNSVEFIKTLPTLVGELWENLLVKSNEIWMSIKNSITEVFNDIGNWFKDIFKSIKEMFGFNDEKTTDDFVNENRGKSESDIQKQLNELNSANDGFFSMWTDEEENRKAALLQLLKDQKLMNKLNKSYMNIQENGEKRGSLQSNIVTNINSSTNQNNINSGKGNSNSPLDSSANINGAYYSNKMQATGGV